MRPFRLPQAATLAAAAAAIALPPAWAALAAEPPERLAASCVLGWGLLALAWIDWRTMRLPNWLTLPLLGAGLAATWLLAPAALAAHLAGALAGYAALALVSHLYRAFRGREGLGLGDAKLLAAGGAWLGWQALPSTVLAAVAMTLVLVLAMRVAGRRLAADIALPFGPALALAIWLAWLYGLPFPGA
ncbi:prepilin peptidase [Marinibaculum pumilum]|uniref:Prepilin peptidase n=1 Tax=Marinibaculum pumilum TaxID=1766165 RepID=A0ABV7L1L1_9PROT